MYYQLYWKDKNNLKKSPGMAQFKNKIKYVNELKHQILHQP